MLGYSDLKSKVFQSFREVGNGLAFLPLLDNQGIANTAYAIALADLATYPPARGLLDALATAAPPKLILISGKSFLIISLFKSVNASV